MEKYLNILKKTQLFAGVSELEIGTMLSCLGAKQQSYKKGEYILRSGQHISDIMVLVSGEVHVQKDDYWGNRSLINVIGPGDMFGEAYSSPDSGPVINDIVAVEDSTVIFFNTTQILTVCSSACKFHTITAANLFYALSEKNRTLINKISYLSNRTTRDKLLSYLSDQAKKQNSSTFTIPLNRQQLADFLSVDRSAMSKELGKMRDEGLLEFDKNNFTLMD